MYRQEIVITKATKQKSRRRKREGFIVGQFPTLKLDAHAIPYSSPLERDFLYFLEYDPAVITYQRRPLEILITPPSGPVLSYIPDFLVTRSNSRSLIMLRSAKSIATATTRERLQLYECWAKDHDYGFHVYTEHHIRSGSILANLQILWRYRSLPVPPKMTRQGIRYLQQYPEGIALYDLAAVLAGDNPPLMYAPYIYHWLFHHLIQIDLNEPLSPQSCIWFSPISSVEEYDDSE